jgi:hypothetical protein
MARPLQPAAKGPFRHAQGMVEGILGIPREPLNHQQPIGPQSERDDARRQGLAAVSPFTPQAHLQAPDVAEEFSELAPDPIPKVGLGGFFRRETEGSQAGARGLGFYCKHE